jgi:cytochrome c peroxidase
VPRAIACCCVATILILAGGCRPLATPAAGPPPIDPREFAPPAAPPEPAPESAEQPAPDQPTPARERVMLGDPALLAGIPGEGPLVLSTLVTWLVDPANHVPLEYELPAWLLPGAGQVKDLTDNPPTRATIELGRQLFFDPRLSSTGTVSCATCHQPEHGFTIDAPVIAGVDGRPGRRNPPALLNRIMLAVGDDRQFWDGRAASVEDALLHALLAEQEMAAAPAATLERISDIECYRIQFEKSYGGVSWSALGDAIGHFVRCLVTGDAPFDHAVRWRNYETLPPHLLAEEPALAARHAAARAAAEAHPMSAAARRGEDLFFGNRAWCSACHNGVNFTDEQYHNIGIGLDRPNPDLGRYEVTGRDADWGAFKTPTIRGAVHTAPYMHDGSLATLADVVEWYAHEGRENRNLDYRFRRVAGGILATEDKRDLVAFIEACSGPLPVVETGRLPLDPERADARGRPLARRD